MCFESRFAIAVEDINWIDCVVVNRSNQFVDGLGENASLEGLKWLIMAIREICDPLRALSLLEIAGDC